MRCAPSPMYSAGTPSARSRTNPSCHSPRAAGRTIARARSVSRGYKQTSAAAPASARGALAARAAAERRLPLDGLWRPPDDAPIPGRVYAGKVSNVMDFGCFVQLENVRGRAEGLVHVSLIGGPQGARAHDLALGPGGRLGVGALFGVRAQVGVDDKLLIGVVCREVNPRKGNY